MATTLDLVIRNRGTLIGTGGNEKDGWTDIRFETKAQMENFLAELPASVDYTVDVENEVTIYISK